MADDIFTLMKNMFIRIAFVTAIPLLIAGCGTLLPDRLVYPNDMKSMEDEKKKEKEIAPSSMVIAEEKNKAEPAVSKKAELVDETQEKEPNAFDYPHPVPDRLKKKESSIDALKSDVGHNALMRLFNVTFEETWNSVVETMMPLNLSAIDKSSGVLITGWIQDERLVNQANVTSGILGDVVRFVRYKYIVRVSDLGGGTRVTVVPFAQVSKNRRWHQGKPSVVITEKLMRKLIKKMEDR